MRVVVSVRAIDKPPHKRTVNCVEIIYKPPVDITEPTQGSALPGAIHPLCVKIAPPHFDCVVCES